MSRPTPSRTVPAILAAIVLLSALAVGATAVFGRTVTPAPEPPPTVEPSIPPTTPPTANPSPPPDGVFEVDLDNLTDHDVSIVVDDETGSVVDVTSGRPGDGMSVRWFDLKIENIDAETLRLVWVGLPRRGRAARHLAGRRQGPAPLRPGRPAGELRRDRLRSRAEDQVRRAGPRR